MGTIAFYKAPVKVGVSLDDTEKAVNSLDFTENEQAKAKSASIKALIALNKEGRLAELKASLLIATAIHTGVIFGTVALIINLES